jgi:ubiquinone/menaquinone biosynthesis C-methylase UbiE
MFGTQRTLERMSVRPGQRILEIGPGPGRLLLPVARQVSPGGEAVGVDIQPGMIAQLTARAADAGISNVIGIAGDAATMTPPGQFDTVYIALALGEIPDRDAVLRRCFDVLKPGGVLSITEMLPDPHFVPQRTVRRLAEGAGFRHKATLGSSLSFTASFEKLHA